MVARGRKARLPGAVGSIPTDLVFVLPYKMIDPQIEESWKKKLWDEFQKPYFLEIKEFLQKEKSE